MQSTNTNFLTHHYCNRKHLMISEVIAFPQKKEEVLDEDLNTQEFILRHDPSTWIVDISAEGLIFPVDIMGRMKAWLPMLKFTKLKKIAFITGGHIVARDFVISILLEFGNYESRPAISFKPFEYKVKAEEWLMAKH
ncbi:hypothetical protein V6R21_01770 [Limibacter armeniacum]|uniref:hypothetical protein n=1 Tax=Limibacter armeniacum TaxID=466084 RepID=UPI002FE52B12